jgi:DNA-binding transcriptional regulator YiaG
MFYIHPISGTLAKQSRLKAEQVISIRENKQNLTTKQLASVYKVCPSTIRNAQSKRTFSYLK